MALYYNFLMAAYTLEDRHDAWWQKLNGYFKNISMSNNEHEKICSLFPDPTREWDGNYLYSIRHDEFFDKPFG